MIETENIKELYASRFESMESAGTVPQWLLPVKKAAIARFTELGFPTTKHESWKYTNVSHLERTPFEPATAHAAKPAADALAPYLPAGLEGPRLVLVNGLFSPSLSRLEGLGAGVTVKPLSAAMASEAELLQTHLGRYVDFREHPFAALNTALMEEGALVHVAKNVRAEQPIHVIHVTAGGDAPLVSHPRLLTVAERGAEVTVLETFVGLGEAECLVNPVSEMVAGEDAHLDHYRVVREAPRTYHLAMMQSHQDRNARFSSHIVVFDGRLTRTDVNAVLAGEGGYANVAGLYVIDGEQHVDNFLHIDHAAPHCGSREFFKGVLQERSRGVFRGRILVREGAQKTDAKQTNMSLLLSDEAQIDSKPQLEIFADDVKCTHGATIGQVDDEAIFYLRARGIDEEAARSILVHAFARESLETIRVEPIRAHLESLLLDRLPQGELLREVS